ncbi:MAG: prepilin-type N-terminal cleavage/methylation domain-containing protein [Candidatus Omnitrophota bacterium]
MLPTGNKKKKSSRGFSLLEVMITATVLALGSSLIYQSFFIAVDSFNYYSTLLKITPWMDEKIWQAQNELRHLGPAASIPAGGELLVNNKSINWSLAQRSLDQTDTLYQIDLVAFWPQGPRQAKLSRSAYALHAEK